MSSLNRDNMLEALEYEIDKASDIAKNHKLKPKGKFKYNMMRTTFSILKHPIISLVFVGIIIIFVVYMVYSANISADEMVSQYTSLTARVENSKAGFDKKLRYIAINEDGTITIKVKYQNELADEEMAGSVSGESFSGSVSSDGSWSGDSIALNALDMYDHYTFTGSANTVKSIHSGVALYDAIPWADDGNWYMLNFEDVNAYCVKNLGQGLQGKTAFHTDNNNSPTVIKNGVACAGIAWVPIFSFVNTNEDGSFSPNWSSSVASNSNTYGVAVLSKDGQIVYLPVGSGGDNKGHTWPGGLVQTYIGNGTRLNGGQVTFNMGGDTDISKIKWDGNRAHQMVLPMSEFVSNWKSKVTYGSDSPVGGSHPSFTLELPSVLVRQLNGYEILGFIMHKGA